MVDRENTNSEEHEQKYERDIVANWNIPVREKKKRIKKTFRQSHNNRKAGGVLSLTPFESFPLSVFVFFSRFLSWN